MWAGAGARTSHFVINYCWSFLLLLFRFTVNPALLHVEDSLETDAKVRYQEWIGKNKITSSAKVGFRSKYSLCKIVYPRRRRDLRYVQYIRIRISNPDSTPPRPHLSVSYQHLNNLKYGNHWCGTRAAWFLALSSVDTKQNWSTFCKTF